MASFDLSTSTIYNKIKYISTAINAEISKWYSSTNYREDILDFRPAFTDKDDDEYTEFIEWFDILKMNQPVIQQEKDKISDDQLLYNLMIYYYLLVIVEYYVLHYSNDFKSFNNEHVQNWMLKFSMNNSVWASYIRKRMLKFNNEKFNSIHIPKFNPYENINSYEKRQVKKQRKF
jgi:hypothetical protein